MNTLFEIFFTVGGITLLGLGILLCLALWVIIIIYLFILCKESYEWYKTRLNMKKILDEKIKKIKGEYND